MLTTDYANLSGNVAHKVNKLLNELKSNKSYVTCLVSEVESLELLMRIRRTVLAFATHSSLQILSLFFVSIKTIDCY